MIPHSRPLFGPDFETALREVAASGHVAIGPQAELLEREIAALVARPAAAAVDSGTAALMLAIRAVAAGREIRHVGLPAYACTSVLHAVLNAGCTPVLMDCGDDLRLIPEQARAQAVAADLVVLVHPFGMVEPMAAESWPCPVIEDIAQSAGATLNGRPVGSFGDMAVVSFHVTKPWGGAYGGMVLGAEGDVAAVRMMRDPDHGRTEAGYAGHHQLSDLHAAMARCRLRRASGETARRRQVAERFDGWLRDSATRPVAGLHEGNHGRYIVWAEGGAQQSIDELRAHGIGAARPVQVPLGRIVGEECPGAEAAWRHCVSLPLLADMTDEEMQRMQEALQACIG